MKSLGRIFELGNNGNKPFKNKYVIVYENKTYFVCKEFGTDYPKIIRKERCIDYSDLSAVLSGRSKSKEIGLCSS